MIDMDLTKSVPRSPYDKLGGVVFLPRAIDKGRAELAGTLGDYISRGGRSGRVFDFLGIPEDGFIEALRTRPTDAEVWEWVSDRMTPRSPEEIEEFNDWMSSASPTPAIGPGSGFRSSSRCRATATVRTSSGTSTGSILTRARCAYRWTARRLIFLSTG